MKKMFKKTVFKNDYEFMKKEASETIEKWPQIHSLMKQLPPRYFCKIHVVYSHPRMSY